MLKGKTAAREYVPEDDIWLRNGRIGREEGNDSMGIGGSNGGEEGGGVEGASIEEVGGFCGGVRDINNHGLEMRGLEYILRPDLRVKVPKVSTSAERQDWRKAVL